jgi:SNF2 family DNA or RNA helicase
LTGTPATKPTDAYGLAKMSNNAFGKSFNAFQLETMIKVSDFKWVPQKDGYDKARRILTPAIRFSLDEVWGGPPMTYQTRMVALTDEQKKLMADLRKSLQVMVKSGKAIDAVNEAAARQKFLQISLGAVYDAEHNVHLVDASPRYSEMADIVESTERKVVIFVPLTSVVHQVDRFLKANWKRAGLDWTCGFINGEVKPKDRTKIIQAFATDPKFKVVIADPQATGHGINEFVAADTVIWMGAIDKTELWIQGNGRVRRPGQKYPSTCFKVVSNKLEDEIFNRLETNTSMQGMMLQAIREGNF